MATLKEYLIDMWVSTKKGYDKTYWIFVIIASAAVVTQVFGISGMLASVVVFAFFYYIGKLHDHLIPQQPQEQEIKA